MILRIHLKQIGQRKRTVEPIDYEYSPVPHTVRELIMQTAAACVSRIRSF